MENGNHGPARRVRIVGQALCWVVAVLPSAWPLLRRPVEGFFDSAASSWDSRTGAGGFDHLQALSSALGSATVRPERVLDIGCGTGETTLFLAREYPVAGVRGVDLSPEMVRRASRRLGLDPSARVSFRVADAASLPWPAESFDLVVQVNVPIFAAEVSRVLRKGGEYLVVSSLGAATPFHTSDRLYQRAITRAGMIPAAAGAVGSGLWRIARLASDD